MKSIIKTAALFICVLMTVAAGAQSSQGAIKGLIMDDEHQPAIGALVQAVQNGTMMKQAVTDENGKYTIKPLQTGKYTVVISYSGYTSVQYTAVEVEAEKTAYVDADLAVNTLNVFEKVETMEWKKPIVDPSYITMQTLNYEQLSVLPVAKGDIKGMIATMSTDIYVTDDGLLYSRGARPGASKYFLDGDALPFNSDVTGMAIQDLTVITGGIPAQFGDVTGAVIVVNTRDYFSGMAEKNIRNSRINAKKQKAKEEEEYKAAKKKREEEIKKEKEEEKKKEEELLKQEEEEKK